MFDFVAIIDIGINPSVFGGLSWHGLFTAIGIAFGVWLSVHLARRSGIPEDDAMGIALVAVPSGIIGARVLWVLEHMDSINTVGDVFNLPDGGISVYGAMIGGVLGAFIFVILFKPNFPKWVALDVAAPGMLLGQAVGRIGDFINGEHFAEASNLPWAFRYIHPETDGPWAPFSNGTAGPSESWVRGEFAPVGYEAVAVHPVAGAYEPLLCIAILGCLFLFRRFQFSPGWGFIFYVLSYALVRGTLAILRIDEQGMFAGLSVPQVLAIVTAGAAVIMGIYLFRKKPAELAVALPKVPSKRSRRVPGGSGRGGRSQRR